MGIFERFSTERLLKWQLACLFAAVVMFPLQGPPIFTKFLSPVSFFGQPSSVPVVIGLLLCVVTCWKTVEDRRGLGWVLAAGAAYLAVVAGISLHAIAIFSPYDETVFKMTPKIAMAASVLSAMGIEDKTLLWKSLVFIRDMRGGVFEVVYAYGFALWIGYLFCKTEGKVFGWVQKAVLWDFCLLVPYVGLEVLHLYGAGG